MSTVSNLGENPCENREFNFVWRIENFTHNVKGHKIRCTEFIAVSGVTWFLDIYSEKNNDSVCDLTKLGNFHCISVNCEFCICTISGERLHVSKNEGLSYSWKESTLNVATFERHIFDNLPKDTLVFHCHLWEKKDSTLPPKTPVHFYERTCVSLHGNMFLWNIEKFSSLLLKEERLFSPQFFNRNHPTFKFKLSLVGRTVDDASIQIIVLSEKVPKETFITFKITAVDTSRISTKCMRDEFILKESNQTKIFPHFLTRSELMAERNLYLPDDVLSLKCEVTFSGEQQEGNLHVVCGQSTPFNVFNQQTEGHPQILSGEASSSLVDDLRSFYEESALSDFEIFAGGRGFPVHRLILSARSPVFRAMFENEMHEKLNGSLTISDLDVDTIDRMLRYVYTDSVPDLGWQETSLLYFAADKYQLTALRQRCSVLLRGQLNKENASEVLALADRHRDQELKRYVQGFVFNRGRAVLDTDQWKRLEQENASLAMETLRYIYCELAICSSLSK